MRKTLGFVSAFALMAGLAASATGPQGSVRQAFSPIGRANAATFAHQQAINGSPTNNYAVIAPTFFTSTNTGPQSYIRFFNGAGAAGSTTNSVFSITLVGDKTGSVYGNTFTLPVPHMASLQKSINDLAGLAGVTPGAFTGADTGYVVYVQNSDKEAGFMHAVYDWTSNLFENFSMCSTTINEQMSSLHNELVLTNVHTSVGSSHIGTNFPSTVRIHNYYNVPITYTITVFNADTGGEVCQLTGNTVAANTTKTLTAASIETNASCSTAAASANYLNLVISDSQGGLPNAIPSHTVGVSQYNGNTAMTTTCAVNQLDTTSTGGGVVISPYT